MSSPRENNKAQREKNESKISSNCNIIKEDSISSSSSNKNNGNNNNNGLARDDSLSAIPTVSKTKRGWGPPVALGQQPFVRGLVAVKASEGIDTKRRGSESNSNLLDNEEGDKEEGQGLICKV
jgi:hypothetical protein